MKKKKEKRVKQRRVVEVDMVEVTSTLRKRNLGTITVVRQGEDDSWEMIYPNGHAQEISGYQDAYRFAWLWFKAEIGPEEIGVGKIEWHL